MSSLNLSVLQSKIAVSNTSNITRGALLLVVAVIIQGIRLVLPLPTIVSMFLVGSLVNLVLIIAVVKNNLSTAFIIAILLPNIAYVQGQLLIPMLIPVVIIGNIAYIWGIYKLFSHKKYLFLVPTFKAALMYFFTFILLQQIPLTDIVKKTISFSMGIAQLVTGVLGIIFWIFLEKRNYFRSIK